MWALRYVWVCCAGLAAGTVDRPHFLAIWMAVTLGLGAILGAIHEIWWEAFGKARFENEKKSIRRAG